MRKMTMWALMACVAGLSGAAFAEQVDNPAYVAWAKHKPGTVVTYKHAMKMEAPNMPPGMGNRESTVTEKLVEVKPEAVVVEVTTEGGGRPGRGPMGGGMGAAGGVHKVEIQAKVEKDKQGLPEQVKGEVKDVKEGTEKVEVSGKNYDAKTREFTVAVTEPMAMESHVKVWSVPEVPGGMVKMENTVSQPMPMMMTMTLVEYKEGK